jgi:hypothetical protein
MSIDDIIDMTQTVALIGVMAVLSYLVHLLKLQLTNAIEALHSIVKALDDAKARLDLLEQERDSRH